MMILNKKEVVEKSAENAIREIILIWRIFI